MKKLVTKLGLGLIFIAMDSPVRLAEVAVFPPQISLSLIKKRETKRRAEKRQSINDEMAGRTGDYNVGGASKRPLNTAYREKCVKLLCALSRCGEETAKTLIKLYDTDPKTGQILRSNHYGWFRRVGDGLYALSEAGEKALYDGSFSELVDYYRREIGNCP